MRIFKTLALIAFLLYNTEGSSQDYKEEIESQFNQYLTTIINRDFEKSVDFIAPEFFDIIPKAQMITLMEMTFNNPSIQFEIKDPKIISVQESEKIEGKYYSLLTYSNQLNMKVLAEEEETNDEMELRLSLTKLSLEQTFGSDNVIYNKETGFYNIQSQKDVYAISKNGKTNWKFIVLEKDQKFILDKLLPKTLSEKL